METNPDYPPEKDQVQIKKGECYKRAYKAIQEMEQVQKLGNSDLDGASLHLIHGTVVSQHPSIRGQRIDHAWIEVTIAGTSAVIDLALNPPESAERSEWVSKLGAREEMRYTPEQARLAAEQATPKLHAGPWHREPQDLP